MFTSTKVSVSHVGSVSSQNTVYNVCCLGVFCCVNFANKVHSCLHFLSRNAVHSMLCDDGESSTGVSRVALY